MSLFGKSNSDLITFFFSARFNHRFDEVRACRQEIVEILDQKLAKQGLTPVSTVYIETFLIFSPQEECCMR